MKPSRAHPVLAMLLAVAIAGCGRNEKSAGSQGLSATELFNLRSQCAELAEKLLQGGVHSAGAQAAQKSKYDSLKNRCYAELDFTLADASSPAYRSTRYLYDGQTRQMLAWYQIGRDGNGPENAACSIYDETALWVPDSTACDSVNAKITEVMTDNR